MLCFVFTNFFHFLLKTKQSGIKLKNIFAVVLYINYIFYRKMSNFTQEKLVKINEMASNYSTILELFGELFNKIEACKSIAGADEILKKLVLVQNCIPTIVVWGAQSSGKSSLLKKLYGLESLSLQIKEGLGTLCPIEFRFKKNLEKQTCVFQPYTGESVSFNTINEVMEHSNIYRDDPRIFECTIIITAKHLFDFRIIDLPGCVVGKERYFDTLKEKYLTKHQTVIVHVRKAIDDTKVDISSKYLNNINTTKITVLTHADMLLADFRKIQYIKDYITDENIYRLAICSDKENELEIIDAIKNHVSMVNTKIIVGTSNLTKVLLSELQTRTGDMTKHIQKLTKESYEAINAELDNIGRNLPNFNDVCFNFKKTKDSDTQDVFHKCGTEYARDFNIAKDKLNVNIIKNIIKEIVPDVSLLSSELSTGSRRKIKGTEESDAIVKKYLKIAKDKLFSNVVRQYINEYGKVIQKSTLKVFISNFKPCTENIELKIKKNISLIISPYYLSISPLSKSTTLTFSRASSCASSG